MASNGTQPPDTAEKSLGEIVNEVTSKAQLLVREEIELARVELTQKATRLAKGAGFFAVAGVLAFFGLIFAFHFLAWGIANWAGLQTWVGYVIVTGFLFILAGIAALLGLVFMKRGTPPTPELAIEEARKTRAALEEARS